MSIYTKLNEAREKFHALKLEKTGENKFAGYKYFELGDFLIPAMKVFKEVGLCAIVSFDKEMARMEITDTEAPMTNSGSNRQFITITSPMGSAALKGCHEVQNIGAVETYQRRYLWVAALEIVEHDALDATTGKDAESKPKTIITPKGGIGEDLPEDWKIYLRDMAQHVTGLVKGGKALDALDVIQEAKLEADQHTYMDSHIDSTTRAALKKAATSFAKA